MVPDKKFRNIFDHLKMKNLHLGYFSPPKF